MPVETRSQARRRIAQEAEDAQNPILRAAAQEREAREAAALAAIARQNENARSAQSQFARISRHDVIANARESARASFLLNRRPAAITDRLATYIHEIRRSNIAPSLSRNITRTIRDRNRVNSTRRILEEKISSLYSLNSEIYNYLNVEQMLYFARNSLSDNFYYRKLELSYGIPAIDKFNQLCQNIIDNLSIDISIDDLTYRYDFDYYNQIVNYLKQVKTELELIKNIHEIRRVIVSEVNSNILNEKTMINNLINHLINQLPTITDQQIIGEVNLLIQKLRDRHARLDEITIVSLNRFFSDKKFEKSRKYCEYILESIITLCKIYLLLIIKLYTIQDVVILTEETREQRETRHREYSMIISNMYNVIVNFTYIINVPSDNTENLLFYILVQNSLYDEIFTSLSIDNQIDRYNRAIPDIIYDLSTPLPAQYSSLHPLTYDLITPPITYNLSNTGSSSSRITRRTIAERITEQRTRERQAARQLREEASNARRHARLVERNARIQAEEEARASRAVAREAERIAAREARVAAREAARAAAAATAATRTATAATRTSTAATRTATAATRTATQQPIINNSIINTSINTNIIGITNFEDKFVSNPQEEESFAGSFITIADNSLITKLKEKITLYSKDFKKNIDRQLAFKDIHAKFKTKFNDDEPVTVIRGSIENIVGNSIASLYSRYQYNGSSSFKFNDLSKYFIVNYTLEKNEDPVTKAIKFKKIRQAGIDAGGLRRDFINALTTELFEKKIFITIEGTKKYFLNPFYEPDEEFIYIVKSNSGFNINVHKAAFIKNFYTFLGILLSFILVNDCGIEHSISSYIIANFNDVIMDEYDYLYFMLIDFPEFSQSLLHLLETPETIEYTCVAYNDYYDLVKEENPDLTSENIEKYILLISKFMMTKTILRKGIEIKGEYETGEQYKELIKHSKMRHHYLVNGIPAFIRTHFSKFTLKSINSYLVTPTMSNDIIQKLIDNFTRAMTKINRNKTGQHKNKHEKLTSLFVSHILTKPAQKSEEEFFKFIEKLLKFWSASSFYKQNEEYKIQINNGLTVQHLPQSHTCFFLIDLPDYTTVGTDDEIGKRLYDKIDNAISNAAGGFLLAGGNRQIIN